MGPVHMLKPKIKPPTLAQRIEELHAEIEALIDKRAAEIKGEAFNQPIPAIKDLIKRGECLCRVAKRLESGD
jgi:hypothetical protein